MGRLLGHRQTKGAATDKPDLTPPRHISTLPRLCENAEFQKSVVIAIDISTGLNLKWALKSQRLRTPCKCGALSHCHQN